MLYLVQRAPYSGAAGLLELCHVAGKGGAGVLEKAAPLISGNKNGNSAYPLNWMDLHSSRPFS